MEKNVGGSDRLVRLVAGPILLVLGALGLADVLTLAGGSPGTALSVIALLLGVVFVVTATTQRCLANALLGVDTCPAE
jgi:uncharacterized membrane protein HdeD (DUF308 family)